jgi:Fic family protein
MAPEMEKNYRIPNPSEPTPDEFYRIMTLVRESSGAMAAVTKADELYLSWHELRNKAWLPTNGEDIFRYVRFMRRVRASPTPVRDQNGSFYSFDDRNLAQFLHEVDLELGGNFLGITDFGETDRRQFVRRNLIEESIASSKLEGANTSREAARKMLREGRSPRDKSERMIFNNHAAMVGIEQTFKNEEMSLPLLKQLHMQVTHGTLDNPELEGTLRNTFDSRGNRLKVMPWDEETVTYVAPDREFVEQQLPQLIAFANDELETGRFIHPLIKAIILHFWIGLQHPFEDGNGRLARILFYWYMLKKGYWAFSYLSLSEKIIRSPKQYAMAYVYAEQDGYDLNYFIHYNIEKLVLARRDFKAFISRKMAENRQTLAIIENGLNLNQRQIALLRHLASDESRYTNMKEYHNLNRDVGYVTAVSDLKRLVVDGFLTKKRVGRNVFYRPTPKVRTIIK